MGKMGGSPGFRHQLALFLASQGEIYVKKKTYRDHISMLFIKLTGLTQKYKGLTSFHQFLNVHICYFQFISSSHSDFKLLIFFVLIYFHFSLHQNLDSCIFYHYLLTLKIRIFRNFRPLEFMSTYFYYSKLAVSHILVTFHLQKVTN